MSDNVVHMKKGQRAEADREQSVNAQGESVSVASEFIYFTPALKQLHILLRQAIVNGDVTQIVCGEAGSGKTLQLNQLLQNIEAEQDICVIHASHVLGEKHIVEEINRCFFSAKNLNVSDIAKQFSKVSTAIDGKVDSDVDVQLNHPLIVVDDAHNLSSFALDTLLSIKQQAEEEGGYLAILLFAKPEIEVTLTSPSLIRFQDLICIHQMPVFGDDEAWEYLHLLLNEYWKDEDYLLTVNEAKSIYHKSEGIPGALNAHMLRVMKEHHHGNFITQFHKRPKMMVSAALGMFAAIFLAILFSGEEPLQSNLPMSAALNLEGQASGRKVVLASLPKEAMEPTSIDKMKLAEKKPRPIIKQDKTEVRIEKPKPVLVQAKKSQALLDKTKGSDIKAKPLVTNTSVKSAKVQKEKLPVIPEPITPEPVLSEPAVKKALAKKRIPSQAENEWLRSQVPDDYTIQLAASASEKAIIRFINKQPVLPELRYVHVKRRGGDWYVVLYGAYQSVSDARRVIKKLSRSLTKNKPWVRHISALQKRLPTLDVAPAKIPQPVTQPEAGLKQDLAVGIKNSVIEDVTATPVPTLTPTPTPTPTESLNVP